MFCLGVCTHFFAIDVIEGAGGYTFVDFQLVIFVMYSSTCDICDVFCSEDIQGSAQKGKGELSCMLVADRLCFRCS